MGESPTGAGPDYEQIVLDVADGVATLTLNRPDRLNAFTGRMAGEIIDAFDRTDADDRVRAIVITGAGRGFCAGADLSGGGSTFDYPEDAPRRDGGGLVSLRVYASLKPVIVAFNGPAVGVGVTMTLPADVRLASTAARFGFVFARRGIVPEAASSWFLPRLVGISRALEWATTGRVFDAQEALAGGLVRSLHEPDELLPAAHALAREIADNTAPVSVALTRHMMWKMLGADGPMAAHELDSRAVEARGKSEDAEEGVTSFLEKRQPRYPNRVSTDMPDFFPWWREEEFTPVEGPRSR
ncbi:crotonase/enoyl-CoA hydratase family protein [Pseudonocardia humida]|uniref:Crotonase/enoyl-CoA hydratase family protein n=1 Tax=Pseudonocardia humida TaxID=2800819 RepID=A0ABT0ZSE4_9PSEU|nr:crotonase/enoyl-CoA hydratase family protein [Pseudonocardia humida]MCO1653624.1 crotonase/enoyl-CoA hydratase family protein [Pseudonocardia humida]